MNKYYKKSEPVTSYGVINIHLVGNMTKYNKYLKIAFNKNSNIEIDKIEIDMENEKIKNIYESVEQNLLFLLVSRKHSLGYIEFMRGNYDIEGDITAKYLFSQMTENEIQQIFSNSFDNLWCGLWKKNAKKAIFTKEYISSNEKFTIIRDTFNEKSFKPNFPISEWGFPKGRKNSNETNIACAIRECCEETSLINTELSILFDVEPLTENMFGTNDVKYKHIYYLSVIEDVRNLAINTDTSHFAEIDTVGWFKKNRSTDLIRPYHIEKLRIIDEVTRFITYVIHDAEENKK